MRGFWIDVAFVVVRLGGGVMLVLAAVQAYRRILRRRPDRVIDGLITPMHFRPGMDRIDPKHRIDGQEFQRRQKKLKDFERTLAAGYVGHDTVTAFKNVHRH